MNMITLLSKHGNKHGIPIHHLSSVSLIQAGDAWVISVVSGMMNFNLDFETKEEAEVEYSRIEQAILKS